MSNMKTAEKLLALVEDKLLLKMEKALSKFGAEILSHEQRSGKLHLVFSFDMEIDEFEDKKDKIELAADSLGFDLTDYEEPGDITSIEVVATFIEQVAKDAPDRDEAYKSVEQQMDDKIDAEMKKDKSLTRAQAARKILDTKDKWFVQTPEGEYLEKVASKK